MTYVASISYGKDSLAMLEAIKILGLPLDRIVHAEVWATDTIQADLPPMVEFKSKADVIIKERYGIDVEHICATNKDGTKKTYEQEFYHLVTPRGGAEREKKYRNATYYRERPIYGFPVTMGAWCNSRLKVSALQRIPNNERKLVYKRSKNEPFSKSVAQEPNEVQYIGIAVDEAERVERHKDKPNIVMPLVEVGWTEADCRKWCEENDLLSPLYETANRGGCWFCHNQGVGQLRLLRKTYPDLWQLLLKWDADSPVTFHADGHTVHDFDKRFQLEDDGILCEAEKFRWDYIKNPPLRQLSLFNEGEIFKE